MKFSARPLASGSSGETVMCLIPAHLMYIWNPCESVPLNGGPPSVFNCSGKPCVEKILSRWGTTASALVLWTNSISGYLVYSSTRTRTWPPVGRGPHRSEATFCHGRCGRGLGFSGSLLGVKVVAWQAMQPDTLASTMSSRFGNHTFDRRSCLHLTMPWWPSWAMSVITWRRLPTPGANSVSGITNLSPRNMTPCV